MDELAFLPAYKIRELIRTKQVSPRELTKLFLSRIEKYNPEYNAYTCVTSEQALEDADRVEKFLSEGNDNLPLLGVPVIVDGSVHLKGSSMRYGLNNDFNELPDDDSEEVKELRKAGAIILGKGNVSELGLTATTLNGISEQSKNPCKPQLSTGGQSGGVACAIAQGLACVGVGPDKNGGVRLPASYCGLNALKATRGRVPLVRHFPLGPLMKATVQHTPVARCVRDIGIMMNVLAYQDSNDYDRIRVDHDNYEVMCGCLPEKVKVGWIPQMDKFPLDPDVAEVYSSIKKTIVSQGLEICEVNLEVDGQLINHFCNFFSCEQYVPIVSMLEREDRCVSSSLMRGTHRWLNYTKTVTGASLAVSISYFSVVRDVIKKVFEECDVLITPASPMTPLTLDEVQEEDLYDGCFRYTLKSLSYLLLYNMSGHPSLVCPAGVTASGAPVGVNVVTDYCREDLLIKFSNYLENIFLLTGKCSPD